MRCWSISWFVRWAVCREVRVELVCFVRPMVPIVALRGLLKWGDLFVVIKYFGSVVDSKFFHREERCDRSGVSQVF